MWALAAVVLDHVPVSGVARILGVAWHTAHAAVAELGRQLLIGHPSPARQDATAPLRGAWVRRVSVRELL